MTAGTLDDEVTGRGEGEHEITTATTWRSPSSPGTVHVWRVLRDSRGGVDFAAQELTVVR